MMLATLLVAIIQIDIPILPRFIITILVVILVVMVRAVMIPVAAI